MSHETLGFAVTNDTIYFFSEVSTGMENGKCGLLPSKKAAFFVDMKQFQHSSFVIHRSYIPEKPIKNLSKKLIKNLPKITQNPLKITLGSLLERSWGNQEGVLDTFSIKNRKYPLWLDGFPKFDAPLDSH